MTEKVSIEQIVIPSACRFLNIYFFSTKYHEMSVCFYPWNFHHNTDVFVDDNVRKRIR